MVQCPTISQIVVLCAILIGLVVILGVKAWRHSQNNLYLSDEWMERNL